jgi:hypothetical protein
MELLEGRELLDGGAVAAAYGQIPLSFEANQGQADPAVEFLSRGSGYALFLTSQEAVLSLSKPVTVAPAATSAAAQSAPIEDVLRLQLVGANASPQVAGVDPLPGTSNYFVGNDPAKWQTNVPTYGKVEYQDVYPGIDLVYYGNQHQLEYDFVVAPGANPGVIGLSVQGDQDMTVDSQGNLVLRTGGGDVLEHAPVVYQEQAGGRQAVDCRYVLLGGDRVSFLVGAYNTSRPLVIDPVLSYATYLGGNSIDESDGIAVDASGDAYVTGIAESSNFPTTPGTIQTTFGSGTFDAFVAKLNATGTALVYSTYLGGSNDDRGWGIAVDASGDAYISGQTSSSNFPTTPGALQRTYGGRTSNAFVAKLNAAGTGVLYSTYLGGSDWDNGQGIAVDASGNAYVTGYTASSDFPTTPGALQRTSGGRVDAFVAKLNTTGTALVYSTYLGGSLDDWGQSIAVDASGNAYVTGQTFSSNFPTTPGALQTTYSGQQGQGDGFVAKLNAAGTGVLYSTYLGGSNWDFVMGIAVDASGNAYVTGYTASSDFPTTPGALQTTYGGGAWEVFVAKLNATGTALVYSTYLGGSYDDRGWGIAVDASGDAYVTGYTTSSNFPTTPGALQAGGRGFVAKLNATGTALLYSTYLGDNGDSIAVDASGNAYVTGYTDSTTFPTTPGAFQPTNRGIYNAFVVKIAFLQAPTVACSVAQSLLWPPNNMLVNVGLTVTVTPADGSLQLLVYADDNASPSDAASIAPGTLQLRSQRQGSGNGRVYLIVALASNAAGTSFDVCAVVVPHDNSPMSIQAVQQRAAAAETFYRQFQAVPAGYVLLGESGGGGAAAPPPRRSGSTGNVLPSETAALMLRVESHSQPAAPSTIASNALTPTIPLEKASPALDRFFASLNKEEWNGLVSRSKTDAFGEIDPWRLDLAPLE